MYFFVLREGNVKLKVDSPFYLEYVLLYRYVVRIMSCTILINLCGDTSMVI